MTRDETIRRGVDAKSILDNTVFVEVFDSLRDDYIKKWELSLDEDIKSREIAYNRLKAIQEVKREFIRLLNAKTLIEK